MTREKLDREIERYTSRTPRSKRLHEEASRYMPGGSSRGTSYFDPYPNFIDHGEGHYVHDVDGNRFLDFMLNATNLIMGHAHPMIIQAIQEQAAKGTAFSGPTEAQTRLAKILSERLPSIDTVRFTSSGTEATMMALRVARSFTGRHKIAKFEGSYHGSHEYASVSDAPSADQLDPDHPTAIPGYLGQPPSLLRDVILLPYNDLERSERIIRDHRAELACVMIDPVPNNLGYIAAESSFLRGIRDLTLKLDVLLIFDEVQSFRVATGGAQELFGVVPDVTALGKIVGGGLPAGAFGGREDIMALYDPSGGGAMIPHSGTFNANPLSMVAGEATLNHLTPEVLQRISALGEMLREKLRAVFDEFEIPAQVTGVASFFGVHFTSEEITDYRTVLRGDRQAKEALFIGMLNEGILLNPASGGSLSTLTTEAEIATLVDAARRVVQRIR